MCLSAIFSSLLHFRTADVLFLSLYVIDTWKCHAHKTLAGTRLDPTLDSRLDPPVLSLHSVLSSAADPTVPHMLKGAVLNLFVYATTRSTPCVWDDTLLLLATQAQKGLIHQTVDTGQISASLIHHVWSMPFETFRVSRWRDSLGQGHVVLHGDYTSYN